VSTEAGQVKATIELVLPVVGSFQSLLVDVPEDEMPRAFDGQPIADRWEEPPVYLCDPRAPPPDIWYVHVLGALAFTPGTVEQLEPFLSLAGELLAVDLPGEGRLSALNVTTVVDWLDWAPEAFDNGQMRPTFVEHRLGEAGLFKIPVLPSLTFSLHREAEDSFSARVRRESLQGVSLVTAWTSRAGPTLPNLLRP
jgi:hypothetical protein